MEIWGKWFFLIYISCVSRLSPKTVTWSLEQTIHIERGIGASQIDKEKARCRNASRDSDKSGDRGRDGSMKRQH